MENQKLEQLSPAGEALFVPCYRCDFVYDRSEAAQQYYCPKCKGCGECGCCPCKKPECDWCSADAKSEAEREMHQISPYEHYAEEHEDKRRK